MSAKQVDKKRLKLMQVGYTAEWALAKFFPVMFGDGGSDLYNGQSLQDLFDLVGICGRETGKEDALERLLDEDIERSQALKVGKNWRIKNTLAEKRSAMELYERLTDNELFYASISNGKLPGYDCDYDCDCDYDYDYDAGVVLSSNVTHLHYIRALLKAEKHILCEKPLVVVTDNAHQADRSQLDHLEDLVKMAEVMKNERKGPNLIMMDSEHYSAKKASNIFFDNVGNMVSKYGRIASINGYTKEKDDPEKQRTRKLLCQKNRTGLLLDMGVHLFGIVTNIEGDLGKIISASYDVYPGHEGCRPYDVETYVQTSFAVSGHLFHDDAKGKFTFAKFIDRFKEPEDEDSKKIEVTFENRNNGDREAATVTIDFRRGTVIDSQGRIWHEVKPVSGEEYVNILRDLYDAIDRKQEPRTSFAHSIKNLDAIHRVYRDFPLADPANLVEVYQR